ncbi:MAG: AGE family epimerase/isomerase [Ferruginibacter sp.]
MLKNLALLPLLFFSNCFAQQKNGLDTILQQLQFAAKEQLLDKYYPRNIDTLYGGYLSSFSFDIQPVGEQDKMIVTQSRHTWSTARAAVFYKDTNYIRMSRHGFYFLRDKMWDPVYGGFFNLVTRQGVVKSTMKEAYGNSFGIFALAAYYDCSRDTSALNLAKKAFKWLEDHSYDPRYKGYFQHLERDGTLVKRPASTPGTSDLGYKDQNSSIHLLEAFTELYNVWPDPLLKTRLHELLILIRDTLVTSKGYLQLFFTPDWKPVSYRDSSKDLVLQHRNLDHVSFGHDVETAFLMMEASEALGIHEDPKTLATGKRMVDHALANGWDSRSGGFYDEGYYFNNEARIDIIRDSKNWWAQAEGLNTLLIMADMYPGDKMQYLHRFKELWKYVNTYLIDHQYGDWYEGGLDKEPAKKTALKAHIWKGTYHSFRALSHCIKRLKEK